MSGQLGSTSIDFSKMIQGLNAYMDRVQSYMAQLQKVSGTVNLQVMFALQFAMQMMSQYMEACSNTLSAVHNEMMTMARATKGT